MIYLQIFVPLFLLIFALFYLYGDKVPQKKYKSLFSIISVLALARIFMVFFSYGHKGDLDIMFGWIDAIRKYGLGGFYQFKNVHYDYTPLYLYILAFQNFLLTIFGAARYSMLESFIMKLPALIGDVALAFLLLKVARKTFTNSRSFFWVIVFLLCPAIVINGVLWGHICSFSMFIFVGSLFILGSNKFDDNPILKYFIVALLFLIACLVKLQVVVFAPIYLFYVCHKADWKHYINVLLGVFMAIVAVVLLMYPLSHTLNPFWFLSLTDEIFAIHNYTALNGFNVYYLFDYNFKPYDPNALNFFSVMSKLVPIMATLFAGYLWYGSKLSPKKKMFFIGLIIYGFVFNFMPGMIERYLFQAIIIGFFAYAALGEKKILPIIISYATTSFINVAWIFSYYRYDGTNPGNNFLPSAEGWINIPLLSKIVCVINLLAFLYSILISFKIMKVHFKNVFPNFKMPEFEKEEVRKKEIVNENRLYKIDARAEKDISRERATLTIWVLTVVFAIISLVYLGRTKAPTTYMMTKQNSEIVLNLGSRQTFNRVNLYCGIGDAVYDIYTSDDSENWNKIDNGGVTDNFKQGYTSVFATVVFHVNSRSQYIKLVPIKWASENGSVTESNDAMIFEISVWNDEEQLAFTSNYNDIFDEQELATRDNTILNGSYFDEIYFARTGWETLKRWTSVYETVQPPMGKNMIALGMAIFGVNPFGWRIMGALAGIVMMPAFYLLATQLFRKRSVGIIAALLLALDFMHFSLPRISTVDSYPVLAIIFAFYFLLKYTDSLRDTTIKWNKIKYLLYSGIAFGLGCSAKLIGVYIAPAILIFLIYSWKNYIYEKKKFNRTRADEIKVHFLYCILFYIIIPSVIYFASYIPLFLFNLRGENIFKYFYDWNYNMIRYHEGVTGTHPFMSEWYEWLINKRPLWAYSNSELGGTGMTGAISFFMNPIICWGGLIAMITLWFVMFINPTRIKMFIICGYLTSLVPWMIIKRMKFEYHYFACVPFLILAICYFLRDMPKSVRYAFIGVCGVVFLVFFPLLSGLPVSSSFADGLKWMPTWTIFSP